MYFKETEYQIKDNRKDKKIRPVDWHEYDAWSMLHLNSHAHQYDGFEQRQRIFGRTPKILIGAVGNPNFSDSMHPDESPVAKTHRVLAKLRERDSKSGLRKGLTRKIKFCLKSSGLGPGKRRIPVIANSLFVPKLTIVKQVLNIKRDVSL